MYLKPHPPMGWICLNTDVAVKVGDNKPGCGGLFRDSDGGGFLYEFDHVQRLYCRIMKSIEEPSIHWKVVGDSS